jgi:cadmium resistance protein CadD (predicted permease)
MLLREITQEIRTEEDLGRVAVTIFFFFWMGLGFEFRASHLLQACKIGTQTLEPHLQSIFALVILEMGSHELFAPCGLEPQSQPPK